MSRSIWTSAGLVALALHFAACADSELGTTAPPPTDGEGGTLPPGDAGTSDDASLDADAGPNDAAPRECSKDGFCHTTVPASQSLRGVWSDGAGTTWAVSKEGAVLRYAGGSWTVHATDLGELFAIWGSGPTDLWIGGESTLYHGQGASPSTLAFTAMKTPGPTTPISSIWGTGADDVWATGGVNGAPLLGRLLHFAGGEWSLEDVSADPIWMHRVFGSAASGVWIAGTVEERDGWFSRRRVVVLRRSVGAKEFVAEALPRDPEHAGAPIGDLARFTDAAVSGDGLSMWVLGRTGASIVSYLRATSTDGGNTFTWQFARTGTAVNPELHAVGAVKADDAFVLGDFGRVRHWDGAEWTQSLITITKFPVTAAFHAIGGRPDDLWFVGDGVALHRVPSKAQP